MRLARKNHDLRGASLALRLHSAFTSLTNTTSIRSLAENPVKSNCCAVRALSRDFFGPGLFAAAALGLAVLPLWPVSPAAAYEDQVTLALGAGYANRFADPGPVSGGLVEIGTSVGIDDIWSAGVGISYLIHPTEEPVHAVLAAVEILYLLDVLEVVPYFGVGLDCMGTAYAGSFRMEAGVHGVVGADYLLSRDLLLGLEVRPLMLVSWLAVDSGYLTANAKIAFIFDL